MSKPTEITFDKRGRGLKSLRLSLIDRCNFRCTYCMPSEIFGPDYPFLRKKDWLTFDEIERVVKAFVQLGVSRIRLTGGEPLLRPGLQDLISRIRGIEGVQDLALTTNGTRLLDMAEKLLQAGLARITVSLDSLDPAVMEKISGTKASVEKIVCGIEKAVELGFEVKINTVIIKGTNESQILPLTEFCIDKAIPLRFIEFMDVGNHNDWTVDRVVKTQEIHKIIGEQYQLKSLNPHFEGEVASRYEVVDRPGRELGFISSVTAPFCSSCNRGRISSDGKFFTCLFSRSGYDLKPIINRISSDSDLRDEINKIWSNREDRYSEIRMNKQSATNQNQKVEMGYIGG